MPAYIQALSELGWFEEIKEWFERHKSDIGMVIFGLMMASVSSALPKRVSTIAGVAGVGMMLYGGWRLFQAI